MDGSFTDLAEAISRLSSKIGPQSPTPADTGGRLEGGREIWGHKLGSSTATLTASHRLGLQVGVCEASSEKRYRKRRAYAEVISSSRCRIANSYPGSMEILDSLPLPPRNVSQPAIQTAL